jgi:DNA repair protein RadC
MRGRGVVGWLAVPFILAHRSRVKGLRARGALASCRPSSSLERCAAACRLPVSGNPARSLEFAMSHDLFSSLESFAAVPSASSSLLVRDVAGEYRPAEVDEVLQAAQRVLAGRVRGSDILTSPAVVKDFLRARLGNLPHEIFAVVHLDAQHRVIDYVEMFRGTVTQTSVYPREVIKDALRLNSCALLLCHCHPSGCAEPSRADEHLTQMLKQAAALVDVRVLDHLIVAGSTVLSMAERGLM